MQAAQVYLVRICFIFFYSVLSGNIFLGEPQPFYGVNQKLRGAKKSGSINFKENKVIQEANTGGGVKTIFC